MKKYPLLIKESPELPLLVRVISPAPVGSTNQTQTTTKFIPAKGS